MSDETTPLENNASAVQPSPIAAQPQSSPLSTSIPVAPKPAFDEPKASPLADEPKVDTPLSTAEVKSSPVAKPAVSAAKSISLELPKAKYGVATKAAAATNAPMKTVPVKKDENPSILSLAVEFVAAAVAIAFAVMIVLDV